MDRRSFLRSTIGGSVVAAGGLATAQSFVVAAAAAPAVPGTSPYGPLLEPDANGLRLPAGFTSRVVAQAMQPVPVDDPLAVPYVYKPFPDGAATFTTEDGGWILVVNSENPPPALDLPAPIIDDLPQDFPVGGGVSAIRFAADGTVVAAYEILSGSRSNCAGGPTPWGTWLSCEEFEANPPGPHAADRSVVTYDGGVVYECDPLGAEPAVIRDLLGHFKHENATVDPATGHTYLSEDLPDGLFYRFTPASFTTGQRVDFTSGVLEAAVLGGNGSGAGAGGLEAKAGVTWVTIDDPTASGGVPTRMQGAGKGATAFDGGEGCVLDGGSVFLTTKNDDRVWEYVIAEECMGILYDGQDFADDDSERILRGVDHINVQPGTGNLVIGEDGGNLEAVMIDRATNAVFPVVQMTGPQHGAENPTPIPTVSEVTGLTFDPSGTRLYFNSQRGFGLGITYEVEGPWDVRAQVDDPPPTTASTTDSTTTPTLPVTGDGGRGSSALVGLGALGAAAIAWRARRAAAPGSASSE